MKIMCVGDSITKGAPANLGGYRRRLAVLAPYLEFVGSQESVGAHEGYPGETIQQISGGALAAATTYGPEIVLLMAGTNDIGDGLLVGAADRLLDLAEDFLAKPTVTSVIVGNIPRILLGGGNTAQMVADCVTFRGQLAATFAAASEGISLYDIGDVVTETPDYYADFTHPNETGYDAMADAWFAALQDEGLARGTTWPMIRALQLELVRELVPTTLPQMRFRAWEANEVFFGEWAEASGGPFRVLHIERLYDDREPRYMAAGLSQVAHSAVVMVSYPRQVALFGRRLDDIIDQDVADLTRALGLRARADYATISQGMLGVRRSTAYRQEGQAAIILAVEFFLEYDRSIP